MLCPFINFLNLKIFEEKRDRDNFCPTNSFLFRYEFCLCKFEKATSYIDTSVAKIYKIQIK